MLHLALSIRFFSIQLLGHPVISKFCLFKLNWKFILPVVPGKYVQFLDKTRIWLCCIQFFSNCPAWKEAQAWAFYISSRTCVVPFSAWFVVRLTWSVHAIRCVMEMCPIDDNDSNHVDKKLKTGVRRNASSALRLDGRNFRSTSMFLHSVLRIRKRSSGLISVL